jgi:hypothetical protein
VHQTTVQGSPTNVGRWGDYLSIRQDYDDAGQSLPSFAATGYALNQNGATLPHFIEFARQERVDFQEGSEEREANLNADALTSAAERLLNSLMHKLQTGANKEDKLFGDLGLIDFQITAGGITLHLRIASKECCKGS